MAADLEQIKSKIEEYRTEMVSSLSALISVPSIAVRTQGPDPFGAPVQQAYEAMLRMGADAGFRTFDADHFGGHLDYEGAGEGIFGIVGHLDVVTDGILIPAAAKSSTAASAAAAPWTTKAL